jgi:hypothetical protein
MKHEKIKFQDNHVCNDTGSIKERVGDSSVFSRDAKNFPFFEGGAHIGDTVN